MLKHYSRLVIVTAGLIFLQAVLLNHLRLFQYFLPIIYLYGFIKMPYQAQKGMLTLSAALAGFILDLLMNTPGLNMAASTLVVYLRPFILRILTTEETIDESDGMLLPNMRSIKPFPYMGYLLFFSLIHTSALMLLEALSVHLFVDVALYILGATLLSTALFLLFDALRFRIKD